MKSIRRTIPSICILLVLGMLALTGCTKEASDSSSEALAVSKGDVQSSQQSASPGATSSPRGKVYFTFFDTVSYVYSYIGDSDELFDERTELVAGILDEYHALFDIYHEYSNVNNLCTLNLNAGGDPIEVDPRLIEFLLYARDLCLATNGEIDITMGSVLSLWHEARNAEVTYLPDENELEQAAKHMGFDLLEIDEQNCTVRLTDPKASIDVGALGKGYATEMAAQALEKLGVSGYVLNIGGNVRILGTRPDGTGWKTGIRNPNDPDGDFALRVNIQDCSCVTSGTYERYFVYNGVRYPHIIDRDTLQPARYFESLTVITKDSGLADALSTAIFCMPYQEGLEMVQKLSQTYGEIGIIWITKDGSIMMTENLEGIAY